MSNWVNFEEVEVWKDIEGYEGKYSVSNYGRVRSLDRYAERADGTTQWVKGRILKATVRNKYMRVILAGYGKHNHQSVHSLVAKTFLPNPFNKEYVNHIDGDKFNNHVSNLEWVTPLENSRDASEKGYYRSGLTHDQSKLSVGEVNEILDLYKYGFYQSEIGGFYGVSQTYISAIVRGLTWHSKEKEAVG